MPALFKAGSGINGSQNSLDCSEPRGEMCLSVADHFVLAIRTHPTVVASRASAGSIGFITEPRPAPCWYGTSPTCRKTACLAAPQHSNMSQRIIPGWNKVACSTFVAAIAPVSCSAVKFTITVTWWPTAKSKRLHVSYGFGFTAVPAHRDAFAKRCNMFEHRDTHAQHSKLHLSYTAQRWGP